MGIPCRMRSFLLYFCVALMIQAHANAITEDWKGAFNSTHVTKIPKSDGKAVEVAAWVKGRAAGASPCKTQVSIGRYSWAAGGVGGYCKAGMEITSVEHCKAAAAFIKYKFGMSGTWSYQMAGCFLQKKDNTVYFNSQSIANGALKTVTDATHAGLCMTQEKNFFTCTSCKCENQGETKCDGFAMHYHASRTGRCVPYGNVPIYNCAALDKDAAYTGKAPSVCTKVGVYWPYLNVLAMPAEEQAYYKDVKGQGGTWATAMCRVRKEVICKDSKNCTNKKQVQCVKVCKLTGFGKQPPNVSDCKTSLCTGKFGAKACTQAAELE